jgi:hypothetical protein
MTEGELQIEIRSKLWIEADGKPVFGAARAFLCPPFFMLPFVVDKPYLF